MTRKRSKDFREGGSPFHPAADSEPPDTSWLKNDAEIFGEIPPPPAPEKRLDFAENGTLQIGRVVMTPVGIQPGTDMTQEEYRNLGEMLLTLEGSIQWILGDWLAYGDERQWGKTYHEVAEAFGRSVDTLYNYASVCRRVDFSLRSEILSFGHHQLVTSMKPREQRTWLTRASDNQWSVAELRRALNPRPAGGTTTFWERAPLRAPNRMVKFWLQSRMGDTEAREKARELVDQARKWLDEYEAGLEGD